MNNHLFICKPIDDILQTSIIAMDGIGEGFNSVPICGYVLQSVFMEMTGCLEQKMKAICWEIATNDDEYRYELLRNNLGECSTYDDKNKVFKNLVKQILMRSPQDELSIKQEDYLTDISKRLDDIFKDTNLQQNNAKCYQEYLTIPRKYFSSCVDYDVSFDNSEDAKINNNLFGYGNADNKKLKQIYDRTIYHRNTIAHNTISPQRNLPTLKNIRDDDYIYENYFVRFTILLLVDRTFVNLFKQYRHCLT
ncbi:hypothetical protein AGMMS49959_17740 [Planctomycetales bacterium]|nr:hypothetical protein AGMMS49959_17740 [Planctomycetales bacterium]